MPARDEPARHGRRVARQLSTEIGSAVLAARLEVGVSQTTAGAAAGMSHAQFGRIERGVLGSLTIDQASRAAAAVGLRLVVKTYPMAILPGTRPILRFWSASGNACQPKRPGEPRFRSRSLVIGVPGTR